MITEDNHVGRDRVERKETAQELGTLAGIEAGFILLGSNIDDTVGIDAEACESVHEFIPLLDPPLAPETIEPEFPIEREEDGWCTVYTNPGF